MAQGYVTGTAHLWVGFLTAKNKQAPPPPATLAVTGPILGKALAGLAAVPFGGGGIGAAVVGNIALGAGGPSAAGAIVSDPPYQGAPVNNPFDPARSQRAYYLGSARESPRIEGIRVWYPWYDDEAGQLLPYDELYEGEEAVVSADINYWNEPVYAAIAKIVNTVGMPPRGIDRAGEVGTSVMMEGFTFSLWVHFTRAGRPTMRAGRGGPMPAGYHYPNAILAGPDRLEPLNSTPSERRLVFRCRRYLDVVTGNSKLFDHDMTGIGKVN